MPQLPSLREVVGGGGLPSASQLVGTNSLPSLTELLSGPSATGKPASRHRSFLGSIEHGVGKVVKQTGVDLYNTAVHSPEGLYQIGKAAATGNVNELGRIAKATGEGFVQDFEHPLRHPGNLLLDLGAAASLGAGTAARLSEVGRVAEAGSAADVLRAAVKGPGPEDRVLTHEGTKVPVGTFSRTASRRVAQKLYDKLQRRFPETRILMMRNLPSRVGHELAFDRRVGDAITRGQAAALAKVRLSLPQQKALHVVAEGVPVEDRIRFHTQQLTGLKGKLAAATRKEIRALEASKKYLTETNGMPRIKASEAKLQDVYDQVLKLARQREGILGGTERIAKVDGETARVPALEADRAAGRIVAPGKIIAPDHTFDPELVQELFRFPYASKQALPALYKMGGFKGGIPREPGSLTHGFQGALLKSGAFRNDTTKLVAESFLEAHRFAALMRHRDEFISLAHDEKTGPHDIPIRMDTLKNKAWPKTLQDLSERPALSKQDMESLGGFYEDMRSHIFPSREQVAADEAQLGVAKHPDVKWIDERLLGGLNTPNPLVGVTGAARKGMNVFDQINSASKAAILYLKPAYAAPNILGNAALNLIQQGWAAPLQVARSSRLWWKLDPELKATLKEAMGEGISGSLHSQEQGHLARAVNKAANLWQGPVDTPFRVNAFLFEARRFGFKTPAQIKTLLGSEEDLLKVAREANSEIIDYGRLGPVEQNIIRRVVFFYPWVKGSSVYAARFLTTHPGQAGVLGQLGKQGAKQDQADLGSLPSYAEGIFKVGSRGGNPLVSNPAAAGILQTPAGILRSVGELASDHPGEAFQFTQNFTPAIQALMALTARQGVRRGQSALQGAEQTLIGGLPFLTAEQGLRHPPSQAAIPRLYPRDRLDVLLHFLAGGIYPTPINLSRAHASAYAEQHPR